MRNGHPYSYIDLERDTDVQNLLEIPTPPFIRSGLKRDRLRKVPRPFVLQVIRKERHLDFSAEILRGVLERDRAEPIAVAAPQPPWFQGPTTRSCCSAVVLLEHFVDLRAAREIFLVEPAGDVQGRHGHLWSGTG